VWIDYGFANGSTFCHYKLPPSSQHASTSSSLSGQGQQDHVFPLYAKQHVKFFKEPVHLAPGRRSGSGGGGVGGRGNVSCVTSFEQGASDFEFVFSTP